MHPADREFLRKTLRCAAIRSVIQGFAMTSCKLVLVTAMTLEDARQNSMDSLNVMQHWTGD
jgi:hypothetical protein